MTKNTGNIYLQTKYPIVEGNINYFSIFLNTKPVFQHGHGTSYALTFHNSFLNSNVSTKTSSIWNWLLSNNLSWPIGRTLVDVLIFCVNLTG